MALLTEEDVRRMSDNGARGPVVVNRGEVLTPGARDWLRAHRVEVVYPQGESPEHAPGAPAPAKYQTLFGAALNNKPEHMTHLRGNTLVFKTTPASPSGGGLTPWRRSCCWPSRRRRGRG